MILLMNLFNLESKICMAAIIIIANNLQPKNSDGK